MLGRLDPLRPKRETALFFRTVDDWIINFDWEINQQLSDYYNGTLTPEQLNEVHKLTLVGPCHLRTEAKMWQIGYSSTASKRITRETAVKEDEPPML